MKTINSIIRGCLLLVAAAALASCGGGGGGESDHPPSIFNLTYAPAITLQVPGGTISINGTVDFTDLGGDVASLRMVSSAGADLTVPISNLSGMTAGTVQGTFVVSADKVGKYTFEIWMTDSRGSISNRLAGAFEVLPAEPTVHPPSISRLRYSPASALPGPNGTVTINAAVDITDVSGGTYYFRMVSSFGADLTVPNSALIDITTGTAAATFNVPVDNVGVFTFEVWLTDGRGNGSNRLSGTFEVLPPADGVYDTWQAWMHISAGTVAMSYSRAGTVGGLSATASGTLLTSWGLTPTTFESKPALERWTAFDGTVSIGGETTLFKETLFSYLDATYLPVGEQTTTYGVVSGAPTIPQTAKVNDTGTLYETLHYSDSTKSTLVGTSTTTYALTAETSSTALMTITTTYKTPTGAFDSSDAWTYRITPDGSAKLLSEVNTEGADVITTTFVSLW